ncbi:MAG: hypothetical protein KatS3mg087_1551 [Patescibacteria group bacterium]|nr:MAG: hypothetical protein KatS3mg087_1551 [Patescibacteria group bacterium]
MAMNTRTAYLEWIYKDVLVNPDGRCTREMETRYVVPMNHIVYISTTPCVEKYGDKYEYGMTLAIKLVCGESILMRVLKADADDVMRVFLSGRTEYLGVIRSLKQSLGFRG